PRSARGARRRTGSTTAQTSGQFHHPGRQRSRYATVFPGLHRTATLVGDSNRTSRNCRTALGCPGCCNPFARHPAGTIGEHDSWWASLILLFTLLGAL